MLFVNLVEVILSRRQAILFYALGLKFSLTGPSLTG